MKKELKEMLFKALNDEDFKREIIADDKSNTKFFNKWYQIIMLDEIEKQLILCTYYGWKIAKKNINNNSK